MVISRVLLRCILRVLLSVLLGLPSSVLLIVLLEGTFRDYFKVVLGGRLSLVAAGVPYGYFSRVGTKQNGIRHLYITRVPRAGAFGP